MHALPRHAVIKPKRMPWRKTRRFRKAGSPAPAWRMQDIQHPGYSPVTDVAPAIANAVQDAVGTRVEDLPIYAEKVRRELAGK